MAAVTDYSYRPSTFPHYPDTASPVYPDRPIRPLPKLRIRSRLTDQQAEAIGCHPVLPSSSPVFKSSLNSREANHNPTPYVNGIDGHVQGDPNHDRVCDCAADPSEWDSDEERHTFRSGTHSKQGHRYSWPARVVRIPRRSNAENGNLQQRIMPPKSSTSSPDGYESFENTNNKKKRKIPVSSATMPQDIAAEDTIAQDAGGGGKDDRHANIRRDNVDGTAAVLIGSGIGISGAGRGRYSKSSSRIFPERRLTGASTNALSAFSGASTRFRGDLSAINTSPANGVIAMNQGFISSAIAKAVETGSGIQEKGQGNVGLLQGPKAETGQPFTFECKSNLSDRMSQGLSRTILEPPSSMTHDSPQHMRHTPMHSGADFANRTSGQQAHSPSTMPPSHPVAQGQVPQPVHIPRPRRSAAREYALAARKRKEAQLHKNMTQPPSMEDRWICEFCEYEIYFDEPPVVLIRDYEVRDRRERKRLAEKRRLLEKAKTKSRKSKKGKAPAKPAAASNSHLQANPSVPQSAQAYTPSCEGAERPEGGLHSRDILHDQCQDSLPLSPEVSGDGPYATAALPVVPSLNGSESKLPTASRLC